MSDSPDGSAEQRMRDLFERQSQFRDKCWYRSALRVSREIKQFAKSEGLIIPYLHACHQLMNGAQDMLEPDLGCEIAIEAIALLESEEKARLIQPDLPEGHYQYTVQWMSACSYDNLAKHVAAREGYNSDGVHDCITDGIQVCRRTGKLECISCFREYATDVYRASDDLEMALHHARAVEQHAIGKEPSEGNDRRWVGARDQIELQLLLGQLDAAEDAMQRALLLHTKYHSPFDAKLDMRRELEVILRLAGRFDEYESLLTKHDIAATLGSDIPSGEAPQFEVESAQLRAIALCCEGKFDEAAEGLTKFDQLLQSRKCLASWFEHRLRLIACYVLGKDTSKVDRLAAQLLDRAKDAHDWLTLRRLRGLLSGNVAPAPIPTAVDLKSGIFARKVRGSGFDVSELAASSEASTDQAVPVADNQLATDAESAQIEQKAVAPEDDISPEFLERINRWFDRFMDQSSGTNSAFDVCSEMLALTVNDTRNAQEAGRLVHTVHIIAPVCGLTIDALNWSQEFLNAFPNDATLVNVVASLGMTARELASSEQPPIDPETVIPAKRLHELFRRSIDLDPERPNNFARAGQFYLTIGESGEAERCFARAFRLDRSNTLVARRLAEIYAGSDRTKDALNVLDLCIREGSQDPEVFWLAGMTALNAMQFQLVASYLTKYEQLVPGEPWVQYYVAVAALETGCPLDAVTALELEAERNPTSPFSLNALRAAVAAAADDLVGLRRHLQAVLAIPLRTVTYLTLMGISRLFTRLYDAVRKLPTDDEVRLQVEQLGLSCGLAPDSYFDGMRANEPIQEELSFYICQFEQPLGSHWAETMYCLPHEESQTAYGARWGVLAQDAIIAERIANAWQSRCHDLLPQLVSVELQSSGIKDQVGIVWQSVHEDVPDPQNDEPIDDETD